MLSAFSIVVRLAWDLLQWCGLLLRPRESLEAKVLFLRRQLALYRERGVKPRRVDAATRVKLAYLSLERRAQSLTKLRQLQFLSVPDDGRLARAVSLDGADEHGRSVDCTLKIQPK